MIDDLFFRQGARDGEVAHRRHTGNLATGEQLLKSAAASLAALILVDFEREARAPMRGQRLRGEWAGKLGARDRVSYPIDRFGGTRVPPDAGTILIQVHAKSRRNIEKRRSQILKSSVEKDQRVDCFLRG
jgi:hypothetical protein